VKTDLSDEEKRLIADALSNNIEPPSELMTKLFPGLAEKFDVVKLDRAKVVTLEYAGKRSEAAILNQASPTDAGSPLQIERCFKGGSLTGETQLDLFKKAKEGTDDNWQNLIVQGDNLQFLKTCYRNADPLIKDRVKGKVKLIYIDPPFGTGDEYGNGEAQMSYTAKLKGSEYIETLRERIIFLREILPSDGCLVLRIDYHFGHFIRVILDELFGRENFRNELVINRIFKNVFGESKFIPTSKDTVYVYSKSDAFEYKDVKVERDKSRKSFWRHMDDSAGIRHPQERSVFGVVLYPPQGKHFKYNQKAIDRMIQEERIRLKCQKCGHIHNGPNSEWDGCPICQEMKPKLQYLVKESTHINLQSNWTDIPGYSTSWNYPTENSEQLLDRVIKTCSVDGALVIDVFAGSGTTAAVAEKLGRRWIVCDFGKHAIYTMQKRMLRIGESKILGKDLKKNKKYDKPPKPFCVVSTGAYDFSRIMKLRENKDAYIDFVLGLFQSSRDEKDLSGKYRLTNIFGEKDGDPVEVYPVWDNEYLKNIRIDEKYLKGIILQSRGKLKSNYYIITPETCTLIGDTTMKNSAGNDVYFKMLKFPYKILEDVSRNFQIQQQPSSQENVNNLINSTGFYFNDDVEIEVERIKQGLKITRFETKILDKQEKHLKGLDGLAMLLVDVDYDGKIFDMDRTVFAKDISDDGMIKMTGLTESVAVIAIDKHGNESKALIIVTTQVDRLKAEGC
jgi:DNA modification methylase